MPDPHRSDVYVRVNGSWRECAPLPFYGIRKVCRCGRKFWRESAYEHHWKVENSRAIYAVDDGDREGPLAWFNPADCGLPDPWSDNPEQPSGRSTGNPT